MKELSKMGSKSMDEFSFPIITNPFSNLMMPPSSSSSSSLWRASSRVFHHEEYYNEDEEGRAMEVRSMCEEGFSQMTTMGESEREVNIECMSCQGDEYWEMEERMDYLWEDFNHQEEKRDQSMRIGSKEICFVKKQGSSRRPTTGAGGSHHRRSGSRSSILVVGRFLKGLLSIKKSAQTKIIKARF